MWRKVCGVGEGTDRRQKSKETRMGEKNKPGRVSQSEGIPLHTHHMGTKSVCMCFCECSTSILGTDIIQHACFLLYRCVSERMCVCVLLCVCVLSLQYSAVGVGGLPLAVTLGGGERN